MFQLICVLSKMAGQGKFKDTGRHDLNKKFEFTY